MKNFTDRQVQAASRKIVRAAIKCGRLPITTKPCDVGWFQDFVHIAYIAYVQGAEDMLQSIKSDLSKRGLM